MDLYSHLVPVYDVEPLGQINNYVCLRFPDRPCIKWPTPHILEPKFYFSRHSGDYRTFFGLKIGQF